MKATYERNARKTECVLPICEPNCQRNCYNIKPKKHHCNRNKHDYIRKTEMSSFTRHYTHIGEVCNMRAIWGYLTKTEGFL